MGDETINLLPAPKKPYKPPQLHELTGSGAEGKLNYPRELFYATGPS